jgi:hypothetical protein
VFKLKVNSVTNPSTNTATTSFIVKTFTSTGALLDELNSGLTTQATPGPLDAFIIATHAEGSDIVGADSKWEITIDPKHEAPWTG